MKETKNNLLNIEKQYQDLEQKVINELKNKVKNSEQISQYIDEKSINVNILNYRELTIIDGKLIFLDENGLHYSIFNCNLKDLIDILKCNNKINSKNGKSS